MHQENNLFDPEIGRNDDLASIDELFHRSIHLRSSHQFIDFIKFTTRYSIMAKKKTKAFARER